MLRLRLALALRCRIEMSLRTKEAAAPSAAVSLAEIPVGALVEGRVRRVEDFGVFVEVMMHCWHTVHLVTSDTRLCGLEGL